MPLPFQIQRFARLLQRRLGLQGYVAPVLVEDVQAVIPLTGSDVAAHFHKQEKRAVVNHQQVAVAAQFSGVGLRNPAGSDHLITVESITVHGAAGLPVGANGWRAFFLRGTPGEGALFNVGPRDGRWSSLDIPFGFVARGLAYTNAAHQAASQWAGVQADWLEHAVNQVLGPGDDFVVETNDLNQTLTVSFRWMEWKLAPGEGDVSG